MSLQKIQGRNESFITLLGLFAVFASVVTAGVGLFGHTAQMQNLQVKQVNGARVSLAVSMIDSTK